MRIHRLTHFLSSPPCLCFPEGIDIAIVWRGFIVSDKWVSNIGGAGLVDWDGPAYNTKGAKVHMGFLDIYKNSLLIDQLPPKQVEKPLANGKRKKVLQTTF